VAKQQSSGQQDTASKIEPWPNFKKFDECTPGELMRVNLSEGKTEWALKGTPVANRLLALFVLTTANAADPHFHDVTENNALRTQLPVLSYGHRYRFAPKHNGPCDLVSGPLLGAAGSFILSGLERLIQAELRPGGHQLYYNIDSGIVDQQPPFNIRNIAALEQWALWLDPPQGHAPPLHAMEFAAEAIALRVVEFPSRLYPEVSPQSDPVR
jgi:hypothetical protein